MTNTFAGAPAPTAAKSTKSLTGVYRWLRGALIVYAVAYALAGLGSLWFAASIPEGYDVQVDMLPAEWLQAAGGLIGIPVYWLCIVLFCVFTFRAMRNLHLWGAPSADMAPGWAVGWYFIPVANLFKPLEGMTQIRDGAREIASQPPVEDTRLGLWWTGWIAGTILNRVAFRVGGGWQANADVSMQSISAALSAVACALLVGAVLAILPVLREITANQERHSLAQAFG